jgi:hypothetical protein
LICLHPDCTGVHDNSRYSELCPRSIELKRARDRYSWRHPDKIFEEGCKRRDHARIRQLTELLGVEYVEQLLAQPVVVRQ